MSVNARAPIPSQPANTYTPDQALTLIEKAAAAGPNALIIAADFLSKMLEDNDIPYAFMGGFSLNIRGSKRTTTDVDVAIGCTMQRLIEVLSDKENILCPLGPVSGVMRIFVKFSNQSADQVASEDMFVSADLILGGSLGAPTNPTVESEILTIQTAAGSKEYRVLNIKAAMAAKLNAFFGRQAQSDFDDLLYLTLQYTESIWNIRDQLNKEHRQIFVNAVYKTYAKDLAKGNVKKVQMALGIAGPETGVSQSSRRPVAH